MKTILVVDDSATSRMLFKIHLPKDQAYDVHEADGVESAIEKAIEVQPDLVVTDYSMPGKNGVELVELLRAKGIKSNFILLTANTQKSVVDAAKDAGISHVVDKPLTAEKVAMVVGELD